MTNKIPLPRKEEFTEYYLNHKRKECAEKYKVSISTIRKWAKNFSLSKRKEWTNQEINLLKKIYPSVSYSMDNIFNSFPNRKHIYNITRMANLLGLKRPTNEDVLPKELTQEQKEIFVGTMFGDACLCISKSGENSNFYFSQKYDNKEYVDYIYNEFLPFSGKGPKMSERPGRKSIDRKVVNDNSKKTFSYFMFTKRHSLFTELEKKWYLRDENGEYILKPFGKNGKMQRIKIVPKDLVLTPRILAFWFFDDGHNNKKKRNLTLCTQSFSLDEVNFLSNLLKKDLGIESYIRKDITLKPFIYIPVRSYLDFINIVNKYNIYDCFKHKTDTSGIKKSIVNKRENVLSNINSTGQSHVIYRKKDNIYIVQININKKKFYFGNYSEKNKHMAYKIAEEISDLKSRGITDINKYKEIQEKYDHRLKVKTTRKNELVSKRKKEFYNYHECKKKVKEYKINTSKDFKEYIKLKNRDGKIPSLPPQYYKEWIDWYDFLGNKK